MDFRLLLKLWVKILEQKNENVSGKYSKERLHHAEQSATDAFKTASKRTIQKMAEAAGDFIGKKIADRITKVSKNSQKNNSETVTNEHDKKNLKKDIYLQKRRQESIDDLRLK